MDPAPSVANSQSARTPAWRTALSVAFFLFIFLVGVRGLGDGFNKMGGDLLDAFFSATSNPLIALMVGILATTLVQSSSATTSMIVALAAAPEHPLPIANAIPMIMGSNIGTTVTNTFVSLAYVGRKDEFQRAFAAATCHDFFNFMAVAILLPLEMATGFLRSAASGLANSLSGLGGASYDSPIKGVIKAAVGPVKSLAAALAESGQAQGAIIAVVSGLLIFGALYALVHTLRSAVGEGASGALQKALGGSGAMAMVIGALVTMAVQSSSITTSLLVPLAGAGLITLRQAFPVTLGANVGTTVTALLASLATTGENVGAGVTIALVHVLFNLVGIVFIYTVPFIRRIPLAAAENLAGVAMRSRTVALAYVVILFYGLPAIFAYLNR